MEKVYIVAAQRTPIGKFNGQLASKSAVELGAIAIKAAVEATLNRPAYVEFDANKLTGKYLRYPERSELNPDINEALIVEYYNR